MADGSTLPAFSLTPAAAARINALAKAEGATALRIAVLGGGCSGFQYEFSLAKTTEPDDQRFELEGAAVLIDPTSLELLGGSQLDYVDELGGAYFSIKNPNATSRCGCGNSFSA